MPHPVRGRNNPLPSPSGEACQAEGMGLGVRWIDSTGRGREWKSGN